MRFGMWNVRSLSGAGSLMTVTKETSKYKLDLVCVQEVRWERGGIEPSREFTIFYGKRNNKQGLGT
jgi:exonuclease III